MIRINESRFYKRSTRLSSKREEILLRKWEVTYLHTLDASRFEYEGSDENVHSEFISESNRDLALKFIVANYYERFSSVFPKGDIDRFLQGAGDYFAMGAMGKTYHKGGRIIGCVLLNRFENYMGLPRPTVHFGYAGYEKESVTNGEARSIKADWVSTARSLAKENDLIDAFTATFNPPSISSFVQKRI